VHGGSEVVHLPQELRPRKRSETALEDVLSRSYGAHIREEDRIPIEWYLRTQPSLGILRTNDSI